MRTAKGKFILDSWHIVFDNQGQFFGCSRGRAIIEFDPKKGTVTGRNYLELYSPTGEPLPGVSGIPGEVTGYRLSVEEPPPLQTPQDYANWRGTVVTVSLATEYASSLTLERGGTL